MQQNPSYNETGFVVLTSVDDVPKTQVRSLMISACARYLMSTEQIRFYERRHVRTAT